MRRVARLGVRALLQAQSAVQSSVAEAFPALSIASRQFRVDTGVARSPTHIEDEPYCRQRQLLVLGNRVPSLSPDAWVAPNAVLVGDVDLYDRVSSIFPFASCNFTRACLTIHTS
jgi:hypothetical protein